MQLLLPAAKDLSSATMGGRKYNSKKKGLERGLKMKMCSSYKRLWLGLMPGDRAQEQQVK